MSLGSALLASTAAAALNTVSDAELALIHEQLAVVAKVSSCIFLPIPKRCKTSPAEWIASLDARLDGCAVSRIQLRLGGISPDHVCVDWSAA